VTLTSSAQAQAHLGALDQAGHEADRAAELPRAWWREAGGLGWLGAAQPLKDGGAPSPAWGRLHAEVGRRCATRRGALTVQAMVADALTRWGSAGAKARWLAPLLSGELVAALALTEPDAGSDAARLTTRAERGQAGWTLTGQKAWTSFGQTADLFLVFARDGDSVQGYLVEPQANLHREPAGPPAGMRASALAHLRLDGCACPLDARLGGGALPGLGLVAHRALELGRLSVAWGCVGAIEGCLCEALTYTRARTIYKGSLLEQPLAQQRVARLVQGARAARLLCQDAAQKRDAHDPDAGLAVLVAKLTASQAAKRAVDDAGLLMGARGCMEGAYVERCRRDAAVMEQIEGPTPLLEALIAEGLGP
jgi:glutaryl-CoA dehydrogenase (non-decarboxylating)